MPSTTACPAWRSLWARASGKREPPPASCARRPPGQERRQRRVRLPGKLDLWHVTAIEDKLARARKRLGHVARERDRHEPVAATPDEQRICLKRAQPRPEALLAMWLVEIDLARGGVEGGTPGRCQVRAEELVDTRCRP